MYTVCKIKETLMMVYILNLSHKESITRHTWNMFKFADNI